MKEKTLKKPEPLPLDTLINFPERKGFFEKSTKKIDPKYLGIPNIQFSLTDENDEREKEYSEQRIERGFDESETWSLTSTIAKFILPRLKAFKKYSNGRPMEMEYEDKEWNKILKKMIDAFSLIIEKDGWEFTEEESARIDKGLKLFQKNFFNLWW